MQPVAPTIISLTGRTILIGPADAHAGVTTKLEQQGARVLAWPRLDPAKPELYAGVDEAIENLFGYDWLVLRNVNAAHFLLRRFQELGHDISEMDSLRVCAIGEATIARLEESEVHIDVFPNRLSSEATFNAIETYVGERNSLAGLNFLIPRAAIASDPITRSLEEVGARVDEVTAYRTCAANNRDLAQIKGLLRGGGIDCIALASSSAVQELAAVFDTNDLFRLLGGVAVCMHEGAKEAAAEFGLHVDFTATESTSSALVRSVSEYFGMTAL